MVENPTAFNPGYDSIHTVGQVSYCLGDPNRAISSVHITREILTTRVECLTGHSDTRQIGAERDLD